MNCPKCGFQQPESSECLSCGIVFAKYRPDAPTHPAPGDAERPAPAPAEAHEPSPFTEPIGTLGKVLRVAAGLLCAANASIMWLNGSGLQTFTMYAVLVFFVVACLHMLVTIGQRITLRQLSIEMAIVVVVSLTAKLSYPQIFDVDAASSQGQPPPKVRAEYAAILEASQDFERDARGLVLEPARLTDRWEAARQTLDGQAVRAAYEAISLRDRVLAYEVTERVKSIATALDPYTRATTPPALPDDVKTRVAASLAELHRELGTLERRAIEAPPSDTPAPTADADAEGPAE